MPTKRLQILANSVKKQQHCIAGRELLEHGGGMSFGNWIRPVSRHGEGELSWSDCRFPNGNTPKIFDLVDIDLEEHAGSEAQPENWFINPKARWRKTPLHPDNPPDLVIDKPRRLWIAPGERADRITPAALKLLDCGSSLYLIEVTCFRIHMSWRKWDGVAQQRCRTLFEYRGNHYDFSLTDPVARDKYCSHFPKAEDGPKIVHLECGGKCILCVSLAALFNGYHYKIAATVIER
jgi:hypothetical protein